MSWDEWLTTEQVSTMCGVGVSTRAVRRLIRRFGMETRKSLDTGRLLLRTSDAVALRDWLQHNNG